MPSREPCMTIGELSRLKGVTTRALHKRAARKPLPEPVVFERPNYIGRLRPSTIGLSVNYRRSELLEWFENSTVHKKA